MDNGSEEDSTCSLTSSLPELRSCTNRGTAPCSMTTFVCSDVPEATLVRAQAASNCKWNNILSVRLKPSQSMEKARLKDRKNPYLQLGYIIPSQKLHKPRDNTCLDDLINWRAAFCTDKPMKVKIQMGISQAKTNI